MKNKLLKIGLTGGIGSGKSTISKIMCLLGIPVYDADQQAKKVMTTEKKVRKRIIDVFGKESYSGKEINRDFLALQIFQNKEKLKALNAIVHPAVEWDFKNWLNNKGNYPFVIKEAALLFETGSFNQLDKIILVTAPLSTRLSRIKKRDPFRSEDEIYGIISKQWSDEKKKGLADEIIQNGDNNHILSKILDLHAQLCNLRKSESS